MRWFYNKLISILLMHEIPAGFQLPNIRLINMIGWQCRFWIIIKNANNWISSWSVKLKIDDTMVHTFIHLVPTAFISSGFVIHITSSHFPSAENENRNKKHTHTCFGGNNIPHTLCNSFTILAHWKLWDKIENTQILHTNIS